MSKATASVKDRFESYFNAKHAKRSPEQIESILKDALVSLEFVLRNSDRVRVTVDENPDPFEVEVEHDDLIDFSDLGEEPRYRTKPERTHMDAWYDFQESDKVYEARPTPLTKCRMSGKVTEWGVQVTEFSYPIKGDPFRCRVTPRSGDPWYQVCIAVDSYGVGRKM